MLGEPSRPTIPLPEQWPSQVRSGVLHAISLAHFTLTFTRSWARAAAALATGIALCLASGGGTWHRRAGGRAGGALAVAVDAPADRRTEARGVTTPTCPVFCERGDRSPRMGLVAACSVLGEAGSPGPVASSVPLNSRFRVGEHRMRSPRDRTVSLVGYRANKRLGAVLGKIQDHQQERDRQRLTRRSLSIREKNRIRGAAARADASGPRA